MKFSNWRIHKGFSFNKANWFHFGANFIVGFMGYPLESYAAWFLWEVSDGFKPSYKDVPATASDIERNLLYSNGFSFEDIFIWNLFGAMSGFFIRGILIELGAF